MNIPNKLGQVTDNVLFPDCSEEELVKNNCAEHFVGKFVSHRDEQSYLVEVKNMVPHEGYTTTHSKLNKRLLGSLKKILPVCEGMDLQMFFHHGQELEFRALCSKQLYLYS